MERNKEKAEKMTPRFISGAELMIFTRFITLEDCPERYLMGWISSISDQIVVERGEK